MDGEMECKPKIRHKYVKAIETGFKCASCEWESVTFDGSTPAACFHCGAPDPKAVWKDSIHNKVSVETLPL